MNTPFERSKNSGIIDRRRTYASAKGMRDIGGLYHLGVMGSMGESAMGVTVCYAGAGVRIPKRR